MSVQILMSTYNGEKYIKTQLDSILAQDYKEIELLIRDDGSSDSTREILNDYAGKYSNVSWYPGKNIGVQKSFFDLVLKANLERDYYAFADQDDQWLPGKISRAVSILESYPKDMPVLYCSDKIIVDDQLRPLKVTVSRVMRRTSFGNALVQDMCTGCTAVMNKNLLNLIRVNIPDYVIMHDWWFYLVATCFGKVYYDEESYILYRQHGNNTSGAMINKYDLLRHRIKQLFLRRGYIYKQVKEFLRIYDNSEFIISESNMQLIHLLINSKRNWRYRFTVAFNREIYRQKTEDNVIFIIILLMGKL